MEIVFCVNHFEPIGFIDFCRDMSTRNASNLCIATAKGRYCEEEIPFCSRFPDYCGPNGECDNRGFCDCDAGFAGDVCDLNIDECEDNQCQSGTCVDRINGYDCQCDFGFEGDFCQIDIDECQSNQCQRGRSETDKLFLIRILNC